MVTMILLLRYLLLGVVCNTTSLISSTISTLDARAAINFGSRSSSIEIGNGAAFNVQHPMKVINGRFKRFEQGAVTGKPVVFNQGVFASFNSESLFTGRYLPDIDIAKIADPAQRAKTGKLELSGDASSDPSVANILVANPGGLNHQLHARDGLNFLRGQPLFFGTQDLTMQGPATLLAIAIQNTLNTNVLFNRTHPHGDGGTIFLQDDLRLGDNAILEGNGTVVLNNRRLSLGGTQATWDGNIMWQQALDLQLNSLVKLNGAWFFAGDNQINGNGNVLDISNGGVLAIYSGSTLRLSGVQLKGLGTGTLLMGATARLILSDVEIEMDQSYVIDSGQVRIDGNCNVITKDNILTIAPGGFLLVDRVALTYDPLDFVDQFNIRPLRIQDPAQQLIRIVNNGSIRKIRAESISFLNYSADTVLERYGVATPNKQIQIFPQVDPSTGQQSFNFTINGGTNFLLFTRSNEPLLTITDGVQVTYENIVLREFSPKHLALGQGASLVFGDQTSVEMARDEQLDMPWVFQGTSYLRGRGSIFTIGQDGAIVVQGKNSVVTLENMTIKGLATDKIKILDPSSSVILKNIVWIQEADMVYSTGGLQIDGTVTMIGPFNFSYQSTSPLSILADGTLVLTRDLIFTYQPSNGDRSLLQLVDPSATLWLEQMQLVAPFGFQLLSGRFLVRGRNQVLTGDAQDTGIVLGDGTPEHDVILDQPSSALLEVSGFFGQLTG